MILENKDVLNRAITKIEKYSESLIKVTRVNSPVEYLNIGESSYNITALSTDKLNYIHNLPKVVTVSSLSEVVTPSISDVYLNLSDNKVYAYIENAYNIIMDVSSNTALKVPKFSTDNVYKKGQVVSKNGNFYKALETTSDIIHGFYKIQPLDMFLSICEISVEEFSGFMDIATSSVVKLQDNMTNIGEFALLVQPTIQPIPDSNAPITDLDVVTPRSYTVPSLGYRQVTSVGFSITWNLTGDISGKGSGILVSIKDVNAITILTYRLVCTEGADGDASIFDILDTTMLTDDNGMAIDDTALSGDAVGNILNASLPNFKSISKVIDCSRITEQIGSIVVEYIDITSKGNLGYTLDTFTIKRQTEV